MLCGACIGLGQAIDDLFVPKPYFHSEVIEINGVEKSIRLQAEGYRHHESISSMIEAAEAGCELCNLLLEETRTSRRGVVTSLDLEQRPIYARVLNVPNKFNSNSASMIIFYQSDPNDPPDIKCLSTVLGIYAYPDDPASKLGFIRGEPVQPHVTVNAYAIAKTWIEDCIKSHPCCRYSSDFFPPRVIYVGPSDGSEEPRLVIDETLRAPWVAISHCWGGRISSATLHSNIDTRLEKLPMSHLPATFQDAITITRELGYRYLWIDALCILQDSQSDWRGHLPYMGNIYQFAVVTIAADVASDSDTGILLERKLAAISVPVPYRSQNRGTEGVVYFRPVLDASPRGPIQTRGWTLQEDLLSVRSLYFSVDQLLWQCQTKTMIEGEYDPPTDQGNHSAGWDDAPLKQSFLLPDGQFATEMDASLSPLDQSYSTPSGRALDHWYSIVNEYVKRGLTVEQDRFPALSGIARQIEKRTGYQYIAGLWKEDIQVGLLWSSNGVGQKRENIECPSWSWAGVAFPSSTISNSPYNIWCGARSLTRTPISATIHSKALIREIDLDASSGDSYGVIKWGTLTIEGKIQTARDWLSRHSRPLLYKEGQRFDLCDLIKLRPYAEPITDSPHVLCALDFHDHWPQNWTRENQAQFEAGISFLQIYRVSGPIDPSRLNRWIYDRIYKKLGIAYALILESTGNEGEYRRRGVAEIPCEEGMADDGWDVRVVKIV
ncbi:heterokaryon incompatibility protein-domain-containing protein [Cadophora sp. MPI-SDFR-AT-0126]|nr:heterokaryon incompatibility protein-domain-containing protein [Leotiomycetes sp. MPI-SDFR-AT-0126]